MRDYLRLLGIARRELAVALLASGCVLAATLADLVLLLLLRRFVDEAIVVSAPALALWLVAQACLLALVRGGAAFFGQRLSLRAGTRLVGSLRERVFGHIQGLSLGLFARHRPGELQARVFNDTEWAARLVGLTVSAVESPARVAGLAAVLWHLDPPLALGAVAFVLPGFVLSRVIGRRLHGRYQEVLATVGEMFERVRESLAAAELTRSYGREAEEREEFGALNRRLVERENEAHDLASAEEPLAHVLRLAGVAAALAYGAGAVARGALTPGALAAVLVAAYALLGAAQSGLGLVSAAQGGLAALRRLFELLDEAPDVPAPRRGAVARFERALRLEGVGFAYAGSDAVLHDVDLVVRPGERLAVVGPTGSGKSTLLRLLPRLHDPTRGRVTLDDVDLRAVDLDSLRSLVILAAQDAPALDRSIRDNVRLGRPDASDAEVESAGTRFGLGPVVAGLAAGWEASVGTAGASLSVGERQRLGLARASLRRARLLLLDEALAAQDAENEARLRDELLALAGETGAAVVFVTHRLASLKGFDRVAVLDRGRVVEDGSPAALLRSAGLYRRLSEAAGLVPDSSGQTASTAEASGRNRSA